MEVCRITKQQELSHRYLSHFRAPTDRVDYHLYGKQREAYASQVNLARSITKRKAVKTVPDFQSSSGSGRAPNHLHKTKPTSSEPNNKTANRNQSFKTPSSFFFLFW